ncbi:MAG: FmdB family zinc ribbon protein [Candidatus Limnocylindrales bacterium]
MPLYDYRCTACGREVEVMHGINDAGPETCAHCGGAMRKALSPPAIHFKGSGWAKKDAAASAGKARSKSDSAKGKDTGKGDAPSGSTEKTKGDGGSASSSSSKAESTASSSAGTKSD